MENRRRKAWPREDGCSTGLEHKHSSWLLMLTGSASRPERGCSVTCPLPTRTPQHTVIHHPIFTPKVTRNPISQGVREYTRLVAHFWCVLVCVRVCMCWSVSFPMSTAFSALLGDCFHYPTLAPGELWQSKPICDFLHILSSSFFR